MIDDSRPWRQQLWESAGRLEARSRVTDWEDEQVAFKIERDLLLGAFAIRRLAEAHKLPTALMNSTVGVEAFARVDGIQDHMNWHHLDRFYDFADVSAQSLGVGQLCNQFIHSFVLMPEADDASGGGMSAVLVASDRLRNEVLYRVETSTIVDLFRAVATEELVGTTMIRGKGGQFTATNWSACDIDGRVR